MNFLKKLSVSALSLSMLFANVKAAPTEDTICQWSLDPYTTLEFCPDTNEYTLIFDVEKDITHTESNYNTPPIDLAPTVCIQDNNTITHAYTSDKCVFMVTLNKADMKIECKKEICFDTSNLENLKNWILKVLDYLSSENLQISCELRQSYFNYVCMLVEIEQNIFRQRSQLFEDYYNNVSNLMMSTRSNLSIMSLRAFKSCLQQYYQAQGIVFKKQEKLRQNFLASDGALTEKQLHDLVTFSDKYCQAVMCAHNSLPMAAIDAAQKSLWVRFLLV